MRPRVGASWRWVGCIAAVAALAGGAAGEAEAQKGRGWVGSSAQLVDMRPVQRVAATCPSDAPCYTSADQELAVVANQDLFFTAWGLGVQGLSATVQLRARQRVAGAFEWPRADDPFDAMLAYAALARGELTVRVGRQEVRSGLGFPSFDGGMVRWSRPRIRVEAYGGRSLARGLRDPAHEALRGLEDFLPDQSVYLVGASARGRISALSMTARYHREILADRSGLASERASLDMSWSSSVGTLRGSLDYDVARREVGKGHLTLSRPFDGARGMIEASAARYVPYFSLSTIWGLFEPVAYTEGTVRVGWAPRDAWRVEGSVGVRRYGAAGTTVVLRPLEDSGRRAGLEATWTPGDAWSAGVSYELEWGPGGYLSSGETRLAWTPSDDTFVTISARTLQQIEQYRLGDGRAWGGGVSAGTQLTDRLSFRGGYSVLRHRYADDGGDRPWSQNRGWSSLRVTLGEDPGLSGRRGGQR
ncbi:MAG: hypothetical protein U5R14_12960 [Gemmatimonadota bacterium]|nr:hypothetical protein [Gemmatimonadota bacterium]